VIWLLSGRRYLWDALSGVRDKCSSNMVGQLTIVYCVLSEILFGLEQSDMDAFKGRGRCAHHFAKGNETW
jgi:hypothetical protein